MAHLYNDGKPALKATEKAKTTRWRCSSASLKLYFRRLRNNCKFLTFIYSTFYLVRHWFDFFCYPWTLDDVLMGPHVPYAVGISIFAGALAWSWRHCRRRANFWALCFSAVAISGTEVYSHVYAPDIVELWRPFSLKSPLACGIVLLSAVLGDQEMYPEESSTALADHSEEDTEAARDAKSVKSHEDSPQTSPTKPQSKISAWTAYVSRKLLTIGTAGTMAFVAAVATAYHHPPTIADEWLSDINCKPQTTKLDFDNEHFEFSATSKSSSFARSCSEPQQLWTLERTMNAHVNESDATCGVWCVRRADDGQWFGYISQVRSGLVDMYYCRGQYGSFGPDCEAEGEEYGYDVSKEGWMDDIFEPWSVLEEDTGEALPPDDVEN